MDMEKLENIKKASWILNRTYENSLKVIFNVTGGLKNFDELATPFTNKDLLKVPQCPRMNIKHTEVAEKIIEMCSKNEFTNRSDINTDEFSLSPFIQTGGYYNLDINGVCDENYLKDDVIIVCLRLKYKKYCLVLIRTMMVTPNNNNNLKKNYNFLLRLQKLILSTLKDGVILGKIYKDVVDCVRNEEPNLLPNLPDNFGSLIGEEPKNGCFSIEANSTEVAKEKMIFNIYIGLHAIYDPMMIEQHSHAYSLWIGDSVQVEKEKAATVLHYTPYETDFAIMQHQRKMFYSHSMEEPDDPWFKKKIFKTLK